MTKYVKSTFQILYSKKSAHFTDDIRDLTRIFLHHLEEKKSFWHFFKMLNNTYLHLEIEIVAIFSPIFVVDVVSLQLQD